MTDANKKMWGDATLSFLSRLLPVIIGSFTVIAASYYWVQSKAEIWVTGVVSSAVADMADTVGQNTKSIDRLYQQRENDRSARTDTAQALASIAETQSTMAETLANAVDRLAALEDTKRHDVSQVMDFLPRGSRIGDGAPGDTVEVTWVFLKLRDDCGRPVVELYFRNGGGRVHRFQNASAIDEQGRGIGMPAQPNMAQSISYTVVIPAGEGVRPGRAQGWNRVTYPGCPGVPPEVSPEVPFTILPRPDGDE